MELPLLMPLSILTATSISFICSPGQKAYGDLAWCEVLNEQDLIQILISREVFTEEETTIQEVR